MDSENQVMHVAHVGYTESEEDFERLRDAEDSVAYWLYPEGERGVDLYENADYIDLTSGRDFLAETQRYDVVVLHRIWYGKDLAHRDAAGGASRHQSPENWRARLIASGAQFIVAYGGTETEVDEIYLGQIPGYSVVFSHPFGDTLNAPKSVYRKED